MVVSTTCDKELAIANPDIIYVSPEQKIIVDLISSNLARVSNISQELSYSCLLKALKQYLNARGFNCFVEGRYIPNDQRILVIRIVTSFFLLNLMTKNSVSPKIIKAVDSYVEEVIPKILKFYLSMDENNDPLRSF